MEESPELGEGHNTTFYRELYTRIGRWWSVDPKAELYYSWSPYNLSADNPIANSDPSGATIVDSKNNKVGVTIGEDNKLSYSFSDKYSAKDKAKIEKRFNKETAPVLESMAKTEMGRKDVMTLSTIPTLVKIEAFSGTNSQVNSYVYPGSLMQNGYRDKATIQPFLGNHKKNGSQSNFDEWLGAAMTVEVGHLEKDQILLDDKASASDPGYLSNPSGKEFQESYKPLLNRATEYRIKYRAENNLPLTKEVFKPLDDYKIEYSIENKKVREEFDKQQK